MIVVVAEQMLGREPILDRLRRKPRLTLCQLIPCPGEKRRKAWCRFDRDFYREHGDEPAQPIELVEFRQNGPKPGDATILDMLGTLRQFAPASRFLPSPFLRFRLEPLLCLCGGEHREPDANKTLEIVPPVWQVGYP